MKTLVTYVSQTGNTKKAAEAIFDEIPDDKDIKELTELTSLEGYDLCFVGFPIIAFGPNPTAKEFLEKNAAGCRGEVDQNIIDFLLKNDDPKMRESGRKGPESKGQPDEARLQRARAWAKDVLSNL